MPDQRRRFKKTKRRERSMQWDAWDVMRAGRHQASV